MAADYLVASLQPLTLDGPAPYTAERFIETCRGQLAEDDAAAIVELLGGAAVAPANGAATSPGNATSGHRILARWRDIDTQIRNAIAAERARLRGQDALRWRRPADGCSLYWANRAVAAFQEKDVARRERLLDQVRWDAAGDLTPPSSPLSVAAVFTYAIRLSIVLRGSARDAAAGNDVFNRLTAASKIDLKERNS